MRQDPAKIARYDPGCTFSRKLPPSLTYELPASVKSVALTVNSITTAIMARYQDSARSPVSAGTWPWLEYTLLYRYGTP
jgi:hypothetical protein